MSFFGKLFGSEKAMDTMVTGASNALDKLWYTDEEKADAAQQSNREIRQMVVNWMQSTQGQNLARRFIALLITSVWLLQKVVSMGLSIASVWVDPTVSEKLIESATVINSASGDMTSAMMLILGFYFAAPHMGSIAEAALKRFGGSNLNKPKE